MGRLIDENKLIDHFVDKTPNGWLVPTRENTSRWSLEGIISEIKHFKPTVEAIPKAEYEARLKKNNELVNDLEELRTMINKFAESYETRLKADMVAMLEEIDLEMSEQSFGIQTEPWEVVEKLRKKIIQQKINALKGETDDK